MRGTSLIGKSVRDLFRTKGLIQIFDRFFLKTKGFLPKLYEIFGSEMPLGIKRIDLLAILKKNLNRMTLVYILKNFRMCTIVIEALTPLHRASRIKMYKNIARSRLFCRIAKRSIVD